MESRLKVLIVEDVATDAGLIARELKKAGIDHHMTRVETEPDFLRALETLAPDIILSDFSMPHFDGLTALDRARAKTPDTPFIFVSGTIGEEVAIESLKRGAVDYILKTNLKRLGPAVKRALQDVEERRARLSAERQLNEARIRFELFMRYLPGAAFIKDAQGRYEFVNWSWEEIRGKKLAEVLGRTDGNLWPELAMQLESNEQLVFDRNDALRSIETFPRPDGVHHYLVHKFPIRDRSGQPVLVGGISIDYTDRLRAEEKVARLSRIQAVLSGINSLIVRVRDRQELFNGACRIAVEAGGFALAWIGLLDKQTLDVKPVMWMGNEDGFLKEIRLSARDDIPEGQGVTGRTIRGKKPVIINDIANDPIVKRAKVSLERGFKAIVALPLLMSDEAIGVLTLYATETGVFDQEEMKLLAELAGDISFALEYIEKTEKLDYLAYYDALTGLPNRNLFHDRLTHVVLGAKQNRSKVAVVLSDIKRFHLINETLGRHAGDVLLREVAQRFNRLWPEPDHVARIAADCFAGVLSNLKEAPEVAHLLEEPLAKSLSLPFAVDGNEIGVSLTAGIAIFPTDGEDTDTLLKNAEAALKKAKADGEKYLFYHPKMNAAVTETLLLENKMRRAIEQEQFTLHYQPKVDLATGRISGLEALIRWNDPETGLVPPGKFIPLLEETGMILDVGVWAIRKAILDRREWTAKGLRPPRVAVNVSPIQLRQKDFVSIVKHAIEDSGQESSGLDLEITESLIMENIEENIVKLTAIRAMGIEIAIDDFGTGYSSLSYIAKLPINALKIDRAFIMSVASSSGSMSIVSTIISLAHSLNLEVIAEGVETEEQRKLLKLLKCDTMQGYLFSKPLPVAEIGAKLKSGEWAV
jgi:diguanylate cyclase (GGDEF)-like protein/PAS domain S-box-containing protein